MRLDSHGTGGARRRLRRHCKAHHPLTFKGVYAGGDLVFELHATDGRTYTLRLGPPDVAAVVQAAADSEGRL